MRGESPTSMKIFKQICRDIDFRKHFCPNFDFNSLEIIYNI